ncbi:MAG: T9SS type A sorting domain-containing protein [Desulfobacterales bacterium]|nr:T9SS type A sorting domain-containing protein [Desulfobacterales bacterium]
MKNILWDINKIAQSIFLCMLMIVLSRFLFIDKITRGSFILFVILSLFIFKSAYAQEVASSSGSHFSSDDFQLSWTIGEPVIETSNSDNMKFTQGMHQSKLIVTSIKEIKDLKLVIKAYPNPATDYVHVEVDSPRNERLSYSLFGMSGELISQGNLVDNLAKVGMAQYTPSTYLLIINSQHKVLKTFKIIKQY